MIPPPVTPLPPHWQRRLGKFLLFLTRGHTPSRAFWLARRDATKDNDYRSAPLSVLDAVWRAGGGWAGIAVNAGRVTSRDLGLELRDDFVTRSIALWRALAPAGWRFERAGGALLARHAGLTLRVTGEEECSILEEIFLAGCYRLHTPGLWQVVDIGANAGFASLHFARQPWVGRVTAFEPFGPTAEAFTANTALNPTLAPKITLERFGLGEADANLMVDYRADLRGSMSVTGLGSWRGGDGPGSAEKISIVLRRASTVFAALLDAAGNAPLFVKMDCEGSEYPILRDLHASGLLPRLGALVIEWHAHGPDELIALLTASGFAVHARALSSDEKTLGLIYAFRMPR